MAEEIEISISPTGQVTVRTIGIKGPKCVQAAEAVAKIIGQIESRTDQRILRGRRTRQRPNRSARTAVSHAMFELPL